MQITIHQALYGEKKGRGHALLAHTFPSEAIPRAIQLETDLPIGTAAAWEPFYKGFGHKDHYVVMRTMPDPDAERGDFVLSHALFIPKEDISRITDLQQLFKLLETTPSRDAELMPVSLTIVPGKPNAVSNSEAVMKAVYGLIYEEKRPIVWIGQDGFSDTVSSIWNSLWPTARIQFRFRVSFSEREAPGEAPDFACTPISLKDRWSAFYTVQPHDSFSSSTTAVKYVLQIDDENNSIRKICREVNVQPASVSELKKWERLADLNDRIFQEKDFYTTKSYLHLMDEVIKEQLRDNEMKNRAVELLAEQLSSGDIEMLLSLRNLDLSSFANTTSLRSAIPNSVSKNVLTLSTSMDLVIKTIESINDASSISWWRTSLLAAFKDSLKKWKVSLAPVIWRWMLNKITFTFIKDLMPSAETTEGNLLSELPSKIKVENGEPLLAFCRAQGWYRLHAAICAVVFKEEEAVSRHLSFDTDHNSTEGVKELASRISAGIIIEQATVHEDNRLIAFAIQYCKRNPQLLKNLNVSNKTWRVIWLGAMNKQEPFKGIADPQQKLFDLLDLKLAGKSIETELLQVLGASSYADLSTYPHRKKIWKVFTPATNEYLQRTAASLLKKYIEGGISKKNLERELEEYIISHNLLSTLLRAENISVSKAVDIIDEWNLPEHELINYIRRSHAQINRKDAEYLGRYISKRKWRSAAEEVSIYERSNRSLQAALDQCYQLLPPKDLLKSVEEFFGGGTYRDRTMNTKKTILFLSANPLDSGVVLATSREQRRIEDKLEAARYRDSFEFRSKTAVTMEALQKAMMDSNAEIVHFSGHSDVKGIVLENDDGSTHYVHADFIHRLFKLFKSQIQCVVLNSCYSIEQAKAISEEGMYVVGMSDTIEDEAAIKFSAAFYQAIGAGKDYEFAFEMAMINVGASHINQSTVPVLWKDGVIIEIK